MNEKKENNAVTSLKKGIPYFWSFHVLQLRQCGIQKKREKEEGRLVEKT